MDGEQCESRREKEKEHERGCIESASRQGSVGRSKESEVTHQGNKYKSKTGGGKGRQYQSMSTHLHCTTNS